MSLVLDFVDTLRVYNHIAIDQKVMAASEKVSVYE
jgi:hypothetical protein